ncbi:MAG: serine--tRNA ligase [Candidatus Thermoplasmatota archaeon]|jgi:seryl-tRNA synthetase|nr:serine--tRNA ligase [Candidatus Thermoplasmatota archaeon]MCL5964044.1 serine--tRNA ligase [Candidatus Thermoplasmatota archaeon]
MLDVKFIRENPDIIRNSLKRRHYNEELLDDFLAVDGEWRSITAKLGSKRKEKNEMSRAIASSVNENEKMELIKKGDEISSDIKKMEDQLNSLSKKRFDILYQLPNTPLPDVPVGKDESENKEIRTWGTPTSFGFKARDHIELGEINGIIDVERAAKVSGARFYYLKKEAVLLEFALVQYVANKLIKKGYIPVIPPVLVREKSMFGTGFLPLGRDDVYKIENEDLYLVGTAEVPLGAMHMDETFRYKDLPIKYFGFSSCFRTEAGAHGRDTKGIFRVHQFDKIEMFKYSVEEESEKEHEDLIKTAEEIFQDMKIPYRIINICTGDLGAPAAKKYDLEAYLPGQLKYREMVSCSNCTDYQARRLNIKYVDKYGNLKYVHTLNSTALAIERTIVAIFENYQMEDGSIGIPDVLKPYIGVLEKIGTGLKNGK